MIEARAATRRCGDKTAVDDLSCTMRPGLVTEFLGPNGAGKSTAMRRATEAESTANLVAAEELSNVVKHLSADRTVVSVHRRHSDVILRVEHDGRGGANPTARTEPAGLADRVDADGGRSAVDRPSVRSTRLIAKLPCAS